jgi:hypothetical protein
MSLESAPTVMLVEAIRAGDVPRGEALVIAGPESVRTPDADGVSPIRWTLEAPFSTSGQSRGCRSGYGAPDAIHTAAAAINDSVAHVGPARLTFPGEGRYVS